MNKEQILLEEYKLCQEHVSRLDQTIWTIGSIIGLGSLGIIAGLIATTARNETIVGAVGAGLLVVVAFWIWFYMARRLWGIQRIIILRMRHIEMSDLSIFKTRYIDYADCKSKARGFLKTSLREDLQENFLTELDNELSKNKNTLKRQLKCGVQHGVKVFGIMLSIVWIIWAGYLLWWSTSILFLIILFLWNAILSLFLLFIIFI